MNKPPERLVWAQRLSALRWDSPWAWPLAHQVGVLTALVLVLLGACVASLSPWWESLQALQQSHQSLSAQYEAGQQKLRDLPDLEQRVQALRDAHERRQRDNAVAPSPWMHPVVWTPVPGLTGANVAPRWRGQTQGRASEVAQVLAQIAASNAALQVELMRTAQAGQWRLTWEVWGTQPPLGSRIEPSNPNKWYPLIDDAPIGVRSCWRNLGGCNGCCPNSAVPRRPWRLLIWANWPGSVGWNKAIGASPWFRLAQGCNGWLWGVTWGVSMAVLSTLAQITWFCAR